MNKKILFVLLIFCFAQLHGQSLSKLYIQCLPSIVKISVIRHDGTSAKGSGFFINENTIATCYHVLQNADVKEILTAEGLSFSFDSIVGCDVNADIATFKIKENNKTWLALANQLPLPGAKVFTIGNPSDMDFTISDGIVSGLRHNQSGNTDIQTTASASTGSSGGPLLNYHAEVIGIVYKILYNGQNLNFALSSKNLLHLKNDGNLKTIGMKREFSSIDENSILNTAKNFYNETQYEKALNAVLPITITASKKNAVSIIKLIGDCYFGLAKYSDAGTYYEATIDYLNKNLKMLRDENVIIAIESLNNLGLIYMMNNNFKEALSVLEQASEMGEKGFVMDTLRHDLFLMLLQQSYYTEAMCNYSLKKTFQACISWRKAQQYGYSKTDNLMEEVCK